MGYDRGDSFPLSYPIPCERKWNTSFLSVKSRPDLYHWFTFMTAQQCRNVGAEPLPKIEITNNYRACNGFIALAFVMASIVPLIIGFVMAITYNGL